MLLCYHNILWKKCQLGACIYRGYVTKTVGLLSNISALLTSGRKCDKLLAKITTKTNINCVSSKYHIVHTDCRSIIYTFSTDYHPFINTLVEKFIKHNLIFICAIRTPFITLFHRLGVLNVENCVITVYYLSV